MTNIYSNITEIKMENEKAKYLNIVIVEVNVIKVIDNHELLIK